MVLDLFKLRVFVTVVDRNGYSTAADHLGLSQATVSFHVHGLERQLGTPLVRYEHREIRLTSAGEQVYRRAVRMLRDVRQLLRSIRTGHEGQISLGASIAFERPFFFEQVLAPYRQARPGVLASIRFGPSVRLAEQVLDHGLDLAYAIGWQVPSGASWAWVARTCGWRSRACRPGRSPPVPGWVCWACSGRPTPGWTTRRSARCDCRGPCRWSRSGCCTARPSGRLRPPATWPTASARLRAWTDPIGVGGGLLGGPGDRAAVRD